MVKTVDPQNTYLISGKGRERRDFSIQITNHNCTKVFTPQTETD